MVTRIAIEKSATAVLFILVVVVEAFVYSLFLMAPSVTLLFAIPPFRSKALKIYHRWMGFIEFCWFGLIAAIIERGFNISVRIYGDRLPHSERSLIICNQRSRLDWMYLFCFCARTGQLSQLKILMKDAIRSIPGIGWAAQMFLFIFISSERTKDIESTRTLYSYFVKNELDATVLLFPEGANVFPVASEKPQRNFEERTIKKLNFVGQPKTLGFIESIQHLGSRLDAVYDITLVHKDANNKTSKAFDLFGDIRCLLSGERNEIHVLAKRTPISSFDDYNDGMLKIWLNERYQKKDLLLSEFFQNLNDGDEAGFPRENDVTSSYGKKAQEVYLFSILFFVSALAGTCFLLLNFWMAKWYAMCMYCTFTIFTGFGNGLDTFELRLGDLFHRSSTVRRRSKSRRADKGKISI